MTDFESRVTVNKPVGEVYSFLADLNNHQQLMPENIYNWTSTADEARFTIQNMAKLVLKVNNRVENKEISIVPAEAAPFDLELKWVLEDNGTTTTAVYKIAADLNMMMKMLVSGPLQKLADSETTSLAQILS
ncbi:hypothetical protein BDD43_3623 [Mucilaginibacter gracilis]|uniref:Polyketide cyclase/dehydrase/lipid transport protein n=1 Tax=Mucilaginibacter gracilis TaxID=423350 RepID=A0A495J359_9SPHI|nr:SRPBCC family protein [Mucilaginibacter gracilis]RKR83415.1 hypothetical protein BDD43_3623 [Mucilaginibacter gracilis]